jgi:cytochrome c5
MRVTVNNLKGLAIALFALPLLTIVLLGSSTARAGAAPDDFDAAAFYKAKCAMCHGAKVEKSFDAAKADDQLVPIVLKGAKPKMPEYESKGVTEDQAKALITLMKSLKQ